MSYTLRGRLETRLAAAATTFLLAAALALVRAEWWPVELVALMTAIGVVVDTQLYHRLFPYQAGWWAAPLGALELALVVLLAPPLGIHAPFGAALALYGAAWLVAQVLGHAVLPLVRLTYAEDGGELGRAGPALAAALVAAFAAAGGVAWAQLPPTVHLSAGVHRGPLVLDHPQRLVGERGAVVRGGIVIRSDDVTVRNVTVTGGENGIDVDRSDHVVIEDVAVAGAKLDGIHVRRSSVAIRDCTIDSLGSEWAQGIDISYTFDRHMSSVERCTVVGGREGIVTHFAMAMLADNRVSRTTFHGISMTEMSMGEVARNDVHGGVGVGIYCGDHSECEIERNVVTNTEADRRSGDLLLAGYGILAHYGSKAELRDNHLVGTRSGVGAILDSRVEHD